MRRGHLQVVLVTGAPGVGKSRLVTEAALRHGEGLQCLSARSYRWGTTVSFGPWLEALDRELRRRTPDEIRALCDGVGTELAPLLASVASVVEARSHQAQVRTRPVEALVEIVARMAGERPLLVTLDDLHLADSSTWEALRHIGRRLTESPIGILATARPAELARVALAQEVVADLEDDGLLVRLGLEPLDRPQLTALAHDVLRQHPRARSTLVPEPLVSWLARRSMGYPLFAIGLLEALLEEGADLLEPRLTRLPASLRERISRELLVIPAEQRHLLELLAVVDRRLDLDELTDLTREEGAQEEGPEPAAMGSVPSVIDALEELVRLRLVTERSDGRELTVEISHPIVQEAVYEGIAAGRRRDMHRRLARRLVAADQLGAAAGHLARSAGRGDAEAVDVLCRAMAQAERRGLHQDALTILRVLLDVLPSGDTRWLDVLAAMEQQPEWVLSHLAENEADIAVTAMHRISEQLAGSDDLVARATVSFHLASFLSFGAGRLDDAEHACREARDRFERAGETERALLAANELAWISGSRGDLEAQERLASEALDRAQHGGHTRAATQAAATAAYAAAFRGAAHRAEPLFARAEALAEAEGNGYRRTWVEVQRGMARGLHGRLADGIGDVERALRTDPRAPDALAFEALAHGRWLAGDLRGALSNLGRSATRRPVRGSRRRAWGTALAARIHAELGQVGHARTALEPAATTYDERAFLVWGFWLPWTTATIDRVELGPEHALGPLSDVREQLEGQGLAPYEALCLVDVAEAAQSVGDVARSRVVAARADELASAYEGALVASCAALTGAYAALAEGDAGTVGRLAATGGERSSAGGYRLLEATAHELAGRASAGRDRARAAEALGEAGRVLDSCGAVWRRDRVLMELGRLGSRGRRAVAALQGPMSLTPREREVAVLAARGFTAREIGQRLYIGHRTVETHLATCYSKLGVASKRELVRRAEELHLGGAGDAPP